MISNSMRSLAVVVLVVLTVGCEKQPSTGPSSGGVSVSGRVLNFVTNIGVSGATVAFGAVTTVTDAGGSYTLVVPAIGRYDDALVDAALIGQRVDVTGSAYRGDFLVRASTCVSRYGKIAGGPAITGAATLARRIATSARVAIRIDVPLDHKSPRRCLSMRIIRTGDRQHYVDAAPAARSPLRNWVLSVATDSMNHPRPRAPGRPEMCC